MNFFADELVARAIVADRLREAEMARLAAIAKANGRAWRGQGRGRVRGLRAAVGGSIERLGRRLSGPPEPAAVDRGC